MMAPIKQHEKLFNLKLDWFMRNTISLWGLFIGKSASVSVMESIGTKPLFEPIILVSF